jgi:hypothetical protein
MIREYIKIYLNDPKFCRILVIITVILYLTLIGKINAVFY